jgi:hypothetical protein
VVDYVPLMGRPSNKRILDRRIDKRIGFAAAAIVAALGAVSVVTGFVGVGTPVTLGSVVVVAGIAFWIYRSRTDGGALPTYGEIGLVALLASTVAFALAWYAARPGDDQAFDFVAQPKNLLVLESVGPQSGTEALSARSYEYGDHLDVTCYTRGAGDQVWYRVTSGNFMPAAEVVAAPLSDRKPPKC